MSAVLLILSFPDFNFEFLAWIGFIPLFFVIENKRPFKAFLISYLTGVLFFLGTMYWLIHVTLPGMIMVVLYLALYFGLFGLIISYFLRKTPNHSFRSGSGQAQYSIRNTSRYHLLLAIPAVWTALELIR